MKKTILFAVVLLTIASCSKEKRSDKKGLSMQKFVIELSEYAKGIDPNFAIIPQNGAELSFNNLDTQEDLNEPYLAAIDGIGIEELYYNGTWNKDGLRVSMLNQIKDKKTILVSDFVSDDFDTYDAYEDIIFDHFVPFVRSSTNYDYIEIPTIVTNENNEDINSMSDVQNYLYLIGASEEQFNSKEELLQAISQTNFDLIILDLEFGSGNFNANDLQALKTKSNGAKRMVISYINVGAAEKYRYYFQEDWRLHRPLWLKKKYDGYDDEFWVKFWKKPWKEIMYGNDSSYMKKILDAGFDGAYLDNVEAYYFLYFD